MSSSPLSVPHINRSHHEHTGAAKQKRRRNDMPVCGWDMVEKMVHHLYIAVPPQSFSAGSFFFLQFLLVLCLSVLIHAACMHRGLHQTHFFCLLSTFLASQSYENKRSSYCVFALFFFVYKVLYRTLRQDIG